MNITSSTATIHAHDVTGGTASFHARVAQANEGLKKVDESNAKAVAEEAARTGKDPSEIKPPHVRPAFKYTQDVWKALKSFDTEKTARNLWRELVKKNPDLGVTRAEFEPIGKALQRSTKTLQLHEIPRRSMTITWQTLDHIIRDYAQNPTVNRTASFTKQTVRSITTHGSDEGVHCALVLHPVGKPGEPDPLGDQRVSDHAYEFSVPYDPDKPYSAIFKEAEVDHGRNGGDQPKANMARGYAQGPFCEREFKDMKIFEVIDERLADRIEVTSGNWKKSGNITYSPRNSLSRSFSPHKYRGEPEGMPLEGFATERDVEDAWGYGMDATRDDVQMSFQNVDHDNPYGISCVVMATLAQASELSNRMNDEMEKRHTAAFVSAILEQCEPGSKRKVEALVKEIEYGKGSDDEKAAALLPKFQAVLKNAPETAGELTKLLVGLKATAFANVKEPTPDDVLPHMVHNYNAADLSVMDWESFMIEHPELYAFRGNVHLPDGYQASFAEGPSPLPKRSVLPPKEIIQDLLDQEKIEVRDTKDNFNYMSHPEKWAVLRAVQPNPEQIEELVAQGKLKPVADPKDLSGDELIAAVEAHRDAQGDAIIASRKTLAQMTPQEKSTLIWRFQHEANTENVLAMAEDGKITVADKKSITQDERVAAILETLSAKRDLSPQPESSTKKAKAGE